MIKTPIVLILGAGASNHMGYPIGRRLVNEVCNKCSQDEFKALCEPEYEASLVEEFRARLSRSDPGSVDAFLETNHDLIEVGRFAIAACLKSKESEDRLFPPNDSGWYHTLFSAMYCDNPEDFALNRLAIVTFNYDRSLECYLHNLIQNRYRLTSKVALETAKTIPIIHIHGSLGTYPQVPYESNATHGIIGDSHLLLVLPLLERVA